ncbi:MAG: GNAT family N-acetyltransferase [Spirochaetes bacterium]|nr:GNAT family N-acetyltransferase [Spirochaetota bacterium]
MLGVLQQARGKGVAKELMKAIVENSSKYNEFVRINVSAIKSYEDFGFVEFKRVPVVKFFKRSKIFRNT